MWQETLAKLDSIPRDELSAPERLNYDVYRPQIETLLANQRFRDYEMPANSDTTFWTDLGYTARRPFRNAPGLPQLDRADARHPALLPGGDGRDAARPEARIHAAAGDHAGARCLDHRRHRGGSGEEPLLYAVQGHAGNARTRSGAPGAGGGRHPRLGAARLPGVAGVHAQRVPAGHAHHARRLRPSRRQGVLPREDPRVHHSRHGLRRPSTRSANRRSPGCTARWSTS